MRPLPPTLTAILDQEANADPDRVLLRTLDGETRLGELQAASLTIAAALRGWGIEPGDRCAIMMENVSEFVSIWFGMMRAGVIEVPVHSAHRGPMLEHILGEVEARILFCDPEVVPLLEGLDLPSLERVVVRGAVPESTPARPTVTSLVEVFTDQPPSSLPELRGSDISCILYTSGTTGPSKGVVLTHTANLQLAVANIELMEYSAADVLYTAFPLFHVNAKFTSVAPALITGAPLVLDRKFSASRFWDRMRAEGVTAFNYMGGLLSILAKQPERADDRDHQVTRAYGGACPPQLWEPFEKRFGVLLLEHYGMTEIGIGTRNTRTVRRPGSIGRPAPYLELRLADEQDREVARGEIGEIQVRPRDPDTILREYWRRPDASLEAFRNLWFHTGDRARMDGDGFLHYVDRLTDSIRRRGENISSFELEAVVGGFQTVVECAAYGVPSDLGEEEVMIAVVAEPGEEIDLDALVAHCEDQLARFAVPRYVRTMKALPRNSSQRVQKFQLRQEGVTADTVDRGDRRRAQVR